MFPVCENFSLDELPLSQYIAVEANSTLKNQAPDFFHISLVSAQILQSQAVSLLVRGEDSLRVVEGVVVEAWWWRSGAGGGGGGVGGGGYWGG